jgi:hypothetical protein
MKEWLRRLSGCLRQPVAVGLKVGREAVLQEGVVAKRSFEAGFDARVLHWHRGDSREGGDL